MIRKTAGALKNVKGCFLTSFGWLQVIERVNQEQVLVSGLAERLETWR